MQQRVGLARALALDADIMLMDEAFSALDPLIRRDMQDELLELQERVKKTIVFISHDLDEAIKIGDRIVLMKDGRVVQVGTAEQILTNPANDYVARFVEEVDMTKVMTAESVMIKPAALAYFKTDGPRAALRKMQKAGISSIFVRRDGKIIGMVTADDAAGAIRTDAKDLKPFLNKDIQTVRTGDTGHRAVSDPGGNQLSAGGGRHNGAAAGRDHQRIVAGGIGRRAANRRDFIMEEFKIPIGRAIQAVIEFFVDHFSFATKAFAGITENGINLLVRP
jgi:ABC-type proline/glycine betaine transport system ATPase subunit